MSETRSFTGARGTDAPHASPSAATSDFSTSGHGNDGHGDSAPGSEGSSKPGQLGQVVANQAQEQAVKISRKARRQATTTLEKQTRRAARIVGALGTALHGAGNQLRAEDEAWAATYYDLAGDRIDHLATTIERQDPEHLLATAQRITQRQPILYFGTAAVIAVVGIRLLRSSSSESDQDPSSHSLQA